MNAISKISKKALEKLQNNGQELTPENYTAEFCKLAKIMRLDLKECVYFQETLAKIERYELLDSSHKEPQSIYDLVDILLQRIPKKNIRNMSKIIQSSMKPSISLSIGDDLNSFCIQIGEEPSLIFEESIQQEMEKFIQNRFQVDQHVLAQKTADIAKLISLMNQYLGDAIESNTDGSRNVGTIKHEIQSFSTQHATQEEFYQLKNKLVAAASTIENEMTSTNKNLESGQNEILLLEKKVQLLESQLKKAQEVNMLDHLTGTLNRRSLEEVIKKREKQFIKENKDYAVVFFDIDHFKNINDTYGHDAGDTILKTFASLILKLTKDSDCVARYGGEEFITLLDYTKEIELYEYVKKIKNVVTKNKFIYKKDKIGIKFSAGVQIRSQNNSAFDTIRQADALLYKAKNTGRNKIIFWNTKEI